jgi:hypothetical protein
MGTTSVTRQTGYLKIGDSSNLITAIFKSNWWFVPSQFSPLERHIASPMINGVTYGSFIDSSVNKNYKVFYAELYWAQNKSITFQDNGNISVGDNDISSMEGFMSICPIFVQYKLSAYSYTETYDPLHFARIQPYALEYAKKEADRSSNIYHFNGNAIGCWPNLSGVNISSQSNDSISLLSTGTDIDYYVGASVPKLCSFANILF